MVYDQRYESVFHLRMLDQLELSDVMGFPIIKGCRYVPDLLVPFGKAVKSTDYSGCVHFFEHDFVFERVWRNTPKYLDMLVRHPAMIAPDFSVFWNAPEFIQIQSIGKSRMVGAWAQQHGAIVIPSIRWGLPSTFDFAFDGVEGGGVLAVGSYGCLQDSDARRVFRLGLCELVNRLSPSDLIVYGDAPDDVFGYALSHGVRLHVFPPQVRLAKEVA